MRFRLLLLALFLVPSGAWAESYTLSIDRARLSMDDETTLTVTLQGSYTNYKPPAGDCYTLSNPSQSTRMSIVNGRVSQSAEYSYRVKPTKPGACVIGPGRVRTKRGWVNTNAVQMTVAKPAPPRKITAAEARNLSRNATEQFFVQPIVPSDALYPGVPFVLGYDLYIRSDTRIQDAGITSEPTLPGFVSYNLQEGTRPKGHTKRIGAQVYTVYPMLRYLVTPLRTGKTELGAVEATIRTGDVFRQRRFKAKSPVVTLSVGALPTQGRPPAFDATSVGRFNITGRVDKDRVRIGEALVYTLLIEGNGNLEHLAPPPFPQTPGLRVQRLPSGADDHIEKDTKGVHGSRQFQYMLTPEAEGSLTIPALEWSTFDPGRREYRRLVTKAIKVVVSGAPVPNGVQVKAAGSVAPAVPARRLSLDEDLDLSAAPSTGPTAPGAPGRALPLATLAAIFLLGLALEARFRRRRYRSAHSASYAQRGALPKALRAIAKTQGLDQAPKALRAIIDRYLHERLGVEPGRLALSELGLRLSQQGVDPGLADRLCAFMEGLEQAAYLAPDLGSADNATLARWREDCRRLLEEVERG